jgi:hypothetical protein
MLMAHPRTLMWSGVLRAVASCGRLVPQAPRSFALGVLLTIIGALILKGCYLSRTVDQATASDVNNRSFTFANGAVFHSALANVSTTLCFTDDATNFSLSSAGGPANGTNRFGSCILTVTDSTYAAGAGPQGGEVITLEPCDFDSERLTLTVSNRDLTTTSTVATACSPGNVGNGTPATASDVNNQSFTFDSGAVFDSALSNVSTALKFTDNATNFTLTSVGISGTATGTSTVQSGSCTLTIANSTYTVGTKVRANSTIKLSPCNFDSTTRKLTVSNAGINATSEASVISSSP